MRRPGSEDPIGMSGIIIEIQEEGTSKFKNSQDQKGGVQKFDNISINIPTDAFQKLFWIDLCIFVPLIYFYCSESCPCNYPNPVEHHYSTYFGDHCPLLHQSQEPPLNFTEIV